MVEQLSPQGRPQLERENAPVPVFSFLQPINQKCQLLTNTTRIGPFFATSFPSSLDATHASLRVLLVNLYTSLLPLVPRRLRLAPCV